MTAPPMPSWCPICCATGRIVLIKLMEQGVWLAQCEECSRPVLLDAAGAVLRHERP